MKETILTLIFCSFMGIVFINAQENRPTGTSAKVSVAPVINGVGDDAAWADFPKYNIDKPFQAEVPTIGASGESYFQTVWNEDGGISVLVVVNDDEWVPGYESGVADWLSDKIEIYMDVNDVLMDGMGGGAGKPTGHYQFAPTPIEEKINGAPTTDANGWTWAYLVDGDASYVFEFYVPFEYLTDKNGGPLFLSRTIGFDVTVTDRDTDAPFRNRAVWANDGTGPSSNESWNNMDDCGWMMFEGTIGLFLVTGIEVSSASDTINTEAGTLQMVATLSPANATYNTVTWSVENITGKASISIKGLLTAQLNGTVKVTGTAKDGTGISGSKVITIINNPVSILNPTTTVEQVMLFPNPVNEKLTIRTTAKDAKVAIFNCLGNVIYEGFILGTESTVDVSDFARGIYYLKVNNAKAQKFVK